MLRRRGKSGESMDELSSSLLPRRGDNGEQMPPELVARSSFQLCKSLLNALLHFWHDILDWIYWKFHIPSVDDSQSLLQASRLEELRRQAAVPYDPTDRLQRSQLQRLWSIAFPEDEFPEETTSDRWKVMGWQSNDPGRDFRGGGALALTLLVRFAEARTEEFLKLMHKRYGERSEWEYPFAAAGVNLTFMLTEVFELRSVAGNQICDLPATPAGLGFARLLSSDEALEFIFMEAFLELDRVWLLRKATYMEFPSVLAEVRRKVSTAVRRRWVRSIEDFTPCFVRGR